MIRLHQIVILSAILLLRCYSALAQGSFDTSISPSELEGQTLEVPRGGLRKVAFTVRYVPSGIEYRPRLWLNGTRFNIGNHDFESRRLLSIVQRSCMDSDKPGERCELLQVTVNGTNAVISELEGSRLQFVVIGARPRSPEEIRGEITLRIVDPVEPVTTTEPETTTEVPVTEEAATTKSSSDIGVSIDPNARIEQCDPIRVETIVPWVFVAVLAALLLLTIVILILVVCKRKKSQKLGDIEGNHPSVHLPDRTAATNSIAPASTTPESGDTNSQGSSSKDSSSELRPS